MRRHMVELPAAGERVHEAWSRRSPSTRSTVGLNSGGRASSGQDANVDTAVDQGAGYCAADKSGCPSDENLHDGERKVNSV